MSPDPPVDSGRSWISRRSVLVLLLLIMLLLVVVGSRRPAGFDPPTLDDPVVIDRAGHFEQRFAAEVTLVREEPVPWAVRLQEEDVNAWLWVRLPAWVAHFEGAGAFGADSMFQIRFLPDRIVICTESVAMAFMPRVGDGELHLSAAPGGALGRLPIPTTLLDALVGSIDLEALVGPMTDELGGDLVTRKGGAWHLPNRITLVDGRRVELLEVRLEEGAVVLVLQTIAASAPASEDS